LKEISFLKHNPIKSNIFTRLNILKSWHNNFPHFKIRFQFAQIFEQISLPIIWKPTVKFPVARA